MGVFDLLPADHSSTHGQAALAALGIISAALYATGLALGAESLARTSFWLLYAEEDRYRLLARNMTDVITRHGRNGAVLFVSPAAESLFGAQVADLLGHGLFDRVHVADRPAYLTALCGRGGERRGALGGVSRAARCERTPTAHPAGQFIWVEMRCRPLERAAGERMPAQAARWSRSCATSPSARRRSRRSKRRAPKPSAPTPPRARSSRP